MLITIQIEVEDNKIREAMDNDTYTEMINNITDECQYVVDQTYGRE